MDHKIPHHFAYNFMKRPDGRVTVEGTVFYDSIYDNLYPPLEREQTKTYQ